MRRVAAIALIATLALGVIAAAIASGDAGLLVSPPEAVAEEFARKVVTGRYEPAMTRVERGAAISPAVMRAAREALRRRHGAVDHVDGVTLHGDRSSATAAARLTTSRSGVVIWQLQLVRRGGTWHVREWREGPRS